MVGVICGAYSSVCITGALWLVMKRYCKKPVPQAALAGSATVSKNTGKQPAKNNQNAQQSGKKSQASAEKEKS